MPGRPGVVQRVLIPLAVIVGTVVLLGGIGWQLAGIKPKTNAEPTTSASPLTSESAPEATPATTTAPEQLTVQVLNGTSTAGLARRTADTINAEGWVIATISNWSGPKVDKTTVFYPEGYEDQAASLAGLVDGDTKPADTLLPQNMMTLVVMD